MPAKRIIACLDTSAGRVLKGRQFISLRDAGEPRELAARYCAQGADEIVMLDVAATVEQRLAPNATIESVARSIDIPLTVGGGVRTLGDVSRLFAAGADRVAINTAALDTPQLISQAAARYGSQSIVIAVDAVRIAPGSYCIATHSAMRRVGIHPITWAVRAASLGAGEVLFTCVHADGMRSGFDLYAVSELGRRLSIPFIASGGAGTTACFAHAFAAGADAALAASVFHEGKLTVGEIKRDCARRGFTVRW